MNISFPLEIATPKKKYQGAEKCIYCRDSCSPLTDEHIIPFAIAGDLTILPRGSCQQCASITGKIEHYCLRDLLGNFRIKTGAPTRRPKDRPKTVTIRKAKFRKEVAELSDIQTITIDGTEYPFMYPAYMFPPAGLLVSRRPETNIDFKITIHANEDDLKKFTDKMGGAWGPNELYRPLEFVRMLAKIAHSYCAAELGVDGFKPYLTDLILGRYEQLNNGLQWVGCEPTIPAPSADLLKIGWDKFKFPNGNKWLIVKFQLFPFFGAPVYHLIVGEWDEDRETFLARRA